MKINIKGSPIAQKRARFARRGAYVKTYDPQSQEKEVVKALMRGQVIKKLEGPLEIEINFYFEVPKSYSKKRAKACLNGDEEHTKKPDIDNLVKFYLDCMNDLVFKDDAQVVKLVARKIYAETPSVEITINDINRKSLG